MSPNKVDSLDSFIKDDKVWKKINVFCFAVLGATLVGTGAYIAFLLSDPNLQSMPRVTPKDENACTNAKLYQIDLNRKLGGRISSPSGLVQGLRSDAQADVEKACRHV
jgi:hypothetical protein